MEWNSISFLGPFFPVFTKIVLLVKNLLTYIMGWIPSNSRNKSAEKDEICFKASSIGSAHLKFWVKEGSSVHMLCSLFWLIIHSLLSALPWWLRASSPTPVPKLLKNVGFFLPLKSFLMAYLSWLLRKLLLENACFKMLLKKYSNSPF